MSLGPLMVDIAGTTLEPEDRDVLTHPAVGGLILFSRNYESPEQIKTLVAAVHALRAPRLLIAVDQEGGRVQRFRDGFTRLPAANLAGQIYDRSHPEGLRYVELAAWVMAAELRAVDVDISFAPVLDLDYGVSDVIGDRALHRKPEAVAELGQAWMRGMRRAGMAATGKHFPGHGGVQADSHLALPEDKRPLVELMQADVRPFERLIHAGLPAVMMAHVVYPKVDALPASFSARWIREILRGELDFRGAVFCDDLSMKGAAGLGSHLDRAQSALAAGCDMLPLCNDRAAVLSVLDGLSEHDDPVSHMRLARLHGRGGQGRATLLAGSEWRHAVAEIGRYAANQGLELDL